MKGKFDDPPGGKKEKPPAMERGKIFKLKIPVRYVDKTYRVLECLGQIPEHQDTFLVEGLPEGGGESEIFSVKIKDNGEIEVIVNPNDYPPLRLME